MNQSELEVNTRNLRQTRENACERGAIGLGFVSHWLRKWHVLFNQSQDAEKPHQSKREITFDTQLKTALINNTYLFIDI